MKEFEDALNLLRKEKHAENRAKLFSKLQLISCAISIAWLIAAFFYRTPVVYFVCLAFVVTALGFGFAASRFRKTAKKIKKETMPIMGAIMGGSGSGKTRGYVMPNMLRDPKSFRQTTPDPEMQREMSELREQAARFWEEHDPLADQRKQSNRYDKADESVKFHQSEDWQ